MKSLLIASIAALVLFNPTQAAGDAEAGKAKAAVCAGCHGPDGNSLAPTFPKIAGQHAAYIEKQLAEYKSGERKNAIMAGIVTALSEQDMADLGAYFASQKAGVGEAAADKVELGQSIYRAGNADRGLAACIACHGPRGSGNPLAKFPALSGQHASYTVAQLQSFRSGERANDNLSMMRSIAMKLSDEEIEAVAQYLQGLH